MMIYGKKLKKLISNIINVWIKNNMIGGMILNDLMLKMCVGCGGTFIINVNILS